MFASCLVISGGNATELLEAIEHPLNAVSFIVNPEVAERRVLPIGPRRNDWSDPMDQEFLSQEITIVARVSNKQPRLADWYRQQGPERRCSPKPPVQTKPPSARTWIFVVEPPRYRPKASR